MGQTDKQTDGSQHCLMLVTYTLEVIRWFENLHYMWNT